jgi:lactoylglutathione lyase
MRILHTMLRVGDLDKSIAFYIDVLGMRLLRKKDYPEGKFTLAFLGYGAESEHTALELTHNWSENHYDIGTGFGHIAINVGDVYEAVKKAKKQGVKIIREAGAMNAGKTIVGFLQDPDGYQIELLSKKF